MTSARPNTFGPLSRLRLSGHNHRSIGYNQFIMATDDLPTDNPPPRRRPRSRLRNIALGMVLGSLAVIIGTVAFLILSRTKHLPPITFDSLNAAVERWNANG